MKMTVIATAVLSLAAAAPAFAQAPNVQGGSSNTANVQVGPSAFPPGSPTGFAGIRMQRSDGTWSGYVNIAAAPINQVTTFATANSAGPFYANHPDGYRIAQVWYNNQNAVANVYSLRQVTYAQAAPWPQFGGLVIGQLKGNTPGSAVYFGEWSPTVSGTPNQGDSTDLNMASSGRTVWYVGDNAVTSMPALVNAQYSVVGIRQTGVGTNLPYAPALYTGTLTANYSTNIGLGAITGSISRNGDSVNFLGTLISSNGTFANFGNTISGRFYNNAAALAGIYTGGGAGNHIAFGGSRSN
ncbi:hypothetical protein E6C76_02650 [Pseudothauera nasutitermitis]|uniref:Transferrin-binding protein B C-lobe/N-lobe beta barrel domain-containing protein n=1 Tax=Pseudothauera nasutitermitis TaxID=2565930 RepID=A0A4S4B8H0_9RHOO|nr:hypothetical protein [Pseudothauera nasutitermitis]THF67293.1 hypothetical protein E6C76_02650 [Pseudothauera nasutitermitis]